eukprot:13624881-Alexandrium_andersonii.AAC.1
MVLAVPGSMFKNMSQQAATSTLPHVGREVWSDFQTGPSLSPRPWPAGGVSLASMPLAGTDLL